jgi:predicted alpha/beta hydrolase
MTGTIGRFAPQISGLSPAQSKILTAAGVVGVICVIAMYISRNQAIKFISLWTLILTGIVTPVLLYTAQGGAGDVMKTKVTDAAQKQQDRLQQVP